MDDHVTTVNIVGLYVDDLDKAVHRYDLRRNAPAKTAPVVTIMGKIVCLLLTYILATSKVISGCVQTCDSAHSWQLL